MECLHGVLTLRLKKIKQTSIAWPITFNYVHWWCDLNLQLKIIILLKPSGVTKCNWRLRDMTGLMPFVLSQDFRSLPKENETPREGDKNIQDWEGRPMKFDPWQFCKICTFWGIICTPTIETLDILIFCGKKYINSKEVTSWSLQL